MVSDLPFLIQIMLHKVVAVGQVPFGPYNRPSSILLQHLAPNYAIEVSDCDILRLSRLWNITYHDCENNHDYKILAIFDEKLMQQVMFDKI